MVTPVGGVHRQARLGDGECLDLALLVDGDDGSMCGRIQVKTGDVLDLGSRGRGIGSLEYADPMWRRRWAS
jgi:hypothetical protein